MELKPTSHCCVEQKSVSGVRKLLNILLAQTHHSALSPLHESRWLPHLLQLVVTDKKKLRGVNQMEALAFSSHLSPSVTVDKDSLAIHVMAHS